MSMSMHLEFFRSPDDDELASKLDAAYACIKAGVPLPEELREYLEPVLVDGLPSDRQKAIDAMIHLGPGRDGEKRFEWASGMSNGFEVVLADLPEGTTKIRFRCNF